MSDINLDVNEITGPMILKRDELLAEANALDEQAREAMAKGRWEAEKILQEASNQSGELDGRAATVRAYADRWSVIIAREETEAGVTVDPTPTLTDGQLDASGVADDA